MPHRDILYVEGCKDYVKLVMAAKTHLLHETMKEMAETLGGRFVHVHRSFIVAEAHIKLLQPEQVVDRRQRYPSAAPTSPICWPSSRSNWLPQGPQPCAEILEAGGGVAGRVEVRGNGFGPFHFGLAGGVQVGAL